MRELESLSPEQLTDAIEANSVVVVLASTPICGTCAVAKKMLTVVSTMLTDAMIVEINLNFHESLAMKEEIMSVPCILIYRNKVCVEKIYAFTSVPFLYEKIKGYL